MHCRQCRRPRLRRRSGHRPVEKLTAVNFSGFRRVRVRTVSRRTRRGQSAGVDSCQLSPSLGSVRVRVSRRRVRSARGRPSRACRVSRGVGRDGAAELTAVNFVDAVVSGHACLDLARWLRFAVLVAENTVNTAKRETESGRGGGRAVWCGHRRWASRQLRRVATPQAVRFMALGRDIDLFFMIAGFSGRQEGRFGSPKNRGTPVPVLRIRLRFHDAEQTRKSGSRTLRASKLVNP